MWNEIANWQERLHQRPDLSAKTIALYTQDARRFATWLQSEHSGLKPTEVTPIDAKTYRDHLLAKRYAPTTINRALISLMLFFDTIDGTNPFRHLTMIDVVEPAPVASWSTWPDGHLFLGQRGPLTERGIREIIAKLGQAAKLASPLGPHDLRHTFAKSLLDPAAYGLDRLPMPLPAIQQLLGHADITTTTIYTRVTASDLARMMGMSEAP